MTRHPLITVLLWFVFTPVIIGLLVFGLAFQLLSCGRVGGFIR